MAVLNREIAEYTNRKDELEANHNGKWVVFHDDEFVGSFDTLDEAAVAAAKRFGLGPYPNKAGWGAGASPVLIGAVQTNRCRWLRRDSLTGFL